MTRATIRTNVLSNLNDAGAAFASIEDVNNSLQDAYNDIAARSRCIIKKAPGLAWFAFCYYIDFINNFNVSDYLGCLAIFNNVSNLWLQDNISLKDFDRIRRDWEKWTGTVMMWAPHSLQYIAVAPTPAITPTAGTFDLYYFANAPIISNDNTAYLIATDMTILLEWYATADQLEEQDEPTKALDFWQRYELKLIEYRERCANLAKKDLLLRL